MDTSPKKTYGWPKNTWKDVQHHPLLEKCKSKPLWGSTLHQPEWLSSKSLQTVSAIEGVEKREAYYIVGGNKNWCNQLWKTVWRFLRKLKNRTTIWPSSPTPGHLSRENHDSQRHMYSSVHCSTICNSQDMETTELSIDRGVARRSGTYTQWNITQPLKWMKYWHF